MYNSFKIPGMVSEFLPFLPTRALISAGDHRSGKTSQQAQTFNTQPSSDPDGLFRPRNAYPARSKHGTLESKCPKKKGKECLY